MKLDGFVNFHGTNDIEKTHDFYCNFLGLRLWLDQATCRLYELPGGNLVGFCEHMKVINDGVMLTFVTDEVDSVYEEFIKKGIYTDGKPRENIKYNIYHFYTKDPDGHALEIQKFL